MGGQPVGARPALRPFPKPAMSVGRCSATCPSSSIPPDQPAHRGIRHRQRLPRRIRQAIANANIMCGLSGHDRAHALRHDAVRASGGGALPLTPAGPPPPHPPGNRSACDARRNSQARPNGHGFAALWAPPQGRSKTNGSKSAQAGLNRSFSIAPLLTTVLSQQAIAMQQSPSFQRIGYDNHRKIRNRDSIKTKVLGEEGWVRIAPAVFWGGGVVGCLPISKPLLPLSTHSAASWRRRKDLHLILPQRSRTWDDDQ